MKARVALIGLIILAVLLGAWWFLSGKPPPTQTRSAASPRSAPLGNQPLTKPTEEVKAPKITAERLEKFNQQLEKYARKSNVPIEFFGKVVDQHGNPIEGVKVTGGVGVSTTDWKNKTIERFLTSTDHNGTFEFRGLKGHDFGIWLEKEGYRFTNQKFTGGSTYPIYKYSFAGNETHRPDPASPVVFEMWKLKGPEPLIVTDKDVRIPYDGTPVNLDLMTGTFVPSGGDIQITLKRTPVQISLGQRNYDWVAKVEAVDGGVVAVSDSEAYPYEAPAEGYQPQIEIGDKSDNPQWQGWKTVNFYLKSRGGKNYGLVKLEFRTDSEKEKTGLGFKAFINPTGSRNLEYDPTKKVTPLRIEQIGLEKALEEAGGKPR